MSILTSKEVRVLDNLCPESKTVGLGTKLQQALSGEFPAGSISSTEIAANAISLAKIAAGIIVGIEIVDAKTTSRDENIAGLASAIALANSLKTVTNAHAADATEHVAGADATNYPVATADATDLATLLALSGALLTAYDVHDDDAELAAAWLYHEGQETGNHTPTSVVTPTTLNEAITRLNDLKSVYNAHDADAAAHLVGSAHQEATVDAALGAAILVTSADALPGDDVIVSILNGGTGSVTGVTGVAGTGTITFTFSGDPQDDAIIGYGVFRAAT